jgi:hypothetical protein
MRAQVRPTSRRASAHTPQVTVWEARAAILEAMPEICARELNELLTALKDRSQDDQPKIVDHWARGYGLRVAWLIEPLTSLVGELARQEDVPWPDPAAWRAQLWVVDEFADIATSATDGRNRARPQMPPLPSRRDRKARTDWIRQWRRTCEEWARASASLAPLEANPTSETRDEFLRRAAQHYGDRARASDERGFGKARTSAYLSQHARWLLRRQVLRESPLMIMPGQPETVRKAIQRLAAVVGFPKMRPVRRAR